MTGFARRRTLIDAPPTQDRSDRMIDLDLPAPLRRHPRLVWALLLLLAAGMRLWAAIERVPLATHRGMPDTQIYLRVAERLATVSPIPEEAFFMSPVYPYLLAGLGRASIWPLLILQILLGVVGLAALALAARRLAGEAAALGTLLLGAVAGPLVLYDTAVLTDGPAAALLALFLGGLVAGTPLRRSRGALLALGVAGALAYGLRANLLLALLLASLWVGWRARSSGGLRRVGWLLLPLVLMMGLIGVLNHAAEGLWAPRSYNAGVNLYLGNNPWAMGVYTTVAEIHPGDPAGRAAAQAARGRPLNSAEVDDFWREQALDFFRSHPGAAARLVLRKLLLSVHPLEFPQMEDQALSRRESTALNLSRVGMGSLLVLAVLGFLGLDAERRRWTGPLLLTAGATLLLCMIFFVNGRLRLGLWPALLPLAGVGLAAFVAALRHRRPRPLLLLIALVGVVSVLRWTVPVHAVYFHANSAARYAVLEALQGHPERARDWLRLMDEYRSATDWRGQRAVDRTFRSHPHSALLLRMERAAALYAMGDLEAAYGELQVVADALPTFQRAQRGLVDVCQQLERRGRATPEITQARRRAEARLRGQGP